MKAVVAAFNQEKALVGAFSVTTNLRMDHFEALIGTIVKGALPTSPLCPLLNMSRPSSSVVRSLRERLPEAGDSQPGSTCTQG